MPNDLSAVSQTEAAQLLGVGLDTLRKYVNDGMPCVQKGGTGGSRAWRFNAIHIVAWKLEREIERITGKQQALDREYWQTVREEEKAKQAMLETAKMQGELVAVDDMQRRVEGMLVKFVNRLDQHAGYAAPLLVGKEELEIRNTLDDEVRKIKETLSSDCVIEDEDEGET